MGELRPVGEALSPKYIFLSVRWLEGMGDLSIVRVILMHLWLHLQPRLRFRLRRRFQLRWRLWFRLPPPPPLLPRSLLYPNAIGIYIPNRNAGNLT